MFEILITKDNFNGECEGMKSIITEDQLKEIIRLLETSKIYKLESLIRIDNGIFGEELLEILKDEVRDNFIQG